MLALLANDLADVPISLLEQAVQRHVASSPYMPKAADLIRLAKDIDGGRSIKIERTAHDLAAARNANLKRDDIEWAVNHDGQLYLQDRPEWTASKTRDLAERQERERTEWKRAQEHAGE